MTPHDFQVAATAWLAAIGAVVLTMAATWATIYPIIRKMQQDVQALWDDHRRLSGDVQQRGGGNGPA